MVEKRKHKRMNSLFYLRVYDRNTEHLTGRMVNLSPDGMMLISEEPVDINRTFKLRMFLPEGMDKRKTITFEANSRWCMKDINPDFFSTGFKLKNISPANVEIINRLIRNYSFEH